MSESHPAKLKNGNVTSLTSYKEFGIGIQ
jgi:hypothetical protein